MPREISIEEFAALAGKAMELSGWLEITQARINQFADATNDHQFIHVKPLRAKFTPFRGTIAHGLLSLSLIGYLIGEQMPVPKGHKMTINYGSDKVRYITPVRVGKRIRAAPTIVEVTEKKPGQWLVKTEVTIEIEGEDKPALTAEILFMHFV
jgi:acyl dehydratase